MKYIIASKNLNKRLQILEATFEENTLKVMATACKPFSDYNGDLYVYVELSTISGRRIKNDIHLKINLYDVKIGQKSGNAANRGKSRTSFVVKRSRNRGVLLLVAFRDFR